jgi:hypothetical protein
LIITNNNSEAAVCPSFIMPGADLVQIEYQSMETMDSMDDYEPKSGTE